MMTWDIYACLIFAFIALAVGFPLAAHVAYIATWKYKYLYITMSFGQKININEFPVLLKEKQKNVILNILKKIMRC
ncbi:hypothetical protein EELLY_v1c02350 [Entomoplasma ellychniae]|uniref:Uncharacterized protein n=1 Tax=Entomoplasma ellychniae TaxID=2114 RepID=A0A8E2QZ59_9MOLU|nr:hypothetical protein EELLY_v1c02350 [Entomoplasma ellychniae]